MNQEPEAKTCKMCGMGIPIAAKKCPYCHHWQRWLSLNNPLLMALLVFLPLVTLYAVLMQTMLFNRFREWERFSQYADQVRIVESRMEFGEDPCGPAVIVVGRVKNSSQVDWKDVRFQAEFFNPKGDMFDAGQQEAFTFRLPAEQETAFKVSFRRQFPEKEYANHKVTIVSAVDSRRWP